MKRYKTAIVAAILIVIVVAAFLVGKNMLPGSSGEAEPTMDTTRGNAFPFSTDQTSEQKIVGLDCIGKETLLLRKQSGSWVCTTYPELQMQEKNIQSLLSKLYSYTIAPSYEYNFESND